MKEWIAIVFSLEEYGQHWCQLRTQEWVWWFSQVRELLKWDLFRTREDFVDTGSSSCKNKVIDYCGGKKNPKTKTIFLPHQELPHLKSTTVWGRKGSVFVLFFWTQIISIVMSVRTYPSSSETSRQPSLRIKKWTHLKINCDLFAKLLKRTGSFEVWGFEAREPPVNVVFPHWHMEVGVLIPSRRKVFTSVKWEIVPGTSCFRGQIQVVTIKTPNLNILLL